ncbi:hypothetical protein KIPB_005158, partial [Kipferlia bialata]|eukprot:g5158.t1
MSQSDRYSLGIRWLQQRQRWARERGEPVKDTGELEALEAREEGDDRLIVKYPSYGNSKLQVLMGVCLGQMSSKVLPPPTSGAVFVLCGSDKQVADICSAHPICAPLCDGIVCEGGQAWVTEGVHMVLISQESVSRSRDYLQPLRILCQKGKGGDMPRWFEGMLCLHIDPSLTREANAVFSVFAYALRGTPPAYHLYASCGMTRG